MESEFFLYPVLESLPLFQGETISLGNDWNNIDGLAELLQHNNVDGLEGMARWLNEEQAAVNPGVLNVAVALGREFLAQVCGVLILDVLDNGIPAAVVVHEIAVTGSVNNVEAESHAILLDNMGDRVNLGGAADLFGRSETTLGVDKVGCEDGVDQGRLAQARLAYRVENELASWTCGGSAQLRLKRGGRTNADDVELKTALEQLLLDL